MKRIPRIKPVSWYVASLAVVALLLFIPGRSEAQFYNGLQMTFGKNRVQYGTFEWTYYDYDRFETYFYLNGKELALFTANYARQELEKIEKRLETSLNDKIQFIIFNTLSDLKQSNIGLVNDQNYNTGGVTHIIGRRVILYFDGDHRNFERQIRSGIINVLLNEMIYGGSLTSQITSSTLLVLPDWYLKGLISYLAEGWNTGYDNRVRDGMLSGKYKQLNRLTGEEAIYAGHSIWRYIAEQYGDNMIPDVVYMTKISKNVESGFLFVLGVSLANLSQEWMQYYTDAYSDSNSPGAEPAGKPILKRIKKEVVYGKVRLSPDGRYIAYTGNDMGKYTIWLQDMKTRKRKAIYRAGFRLDEKTDYSYPLISWHPNSNILAFMTEAKGKIFLYYYNLNDRKIDKIPFYRFEKIVDFSFSHDAKYFAMSAVQKGQSDLFIYNISSRTYEQVTNDISDDLYPRFIGSSRQIIFSSNRSNDTLRFGKLQKIAASPPNHDLFIYDFARKSTVLRRVTNTPAADEIMPMEYGTGYFTYLSDENGIYNRFLGRFDSTISRIDTVIHYRYFTDAKPVTDYSQSILDHDVNPLAGVSAEVVFQKGAYHLFLKEANTFGNTEAPELRNTIYRQQVLDNLAKVVETPVEVVPKKRKRLSSVRVGETEQTDSTKIDINNYSFDKQAFIKLNIGVEDAIGKVIKTDSVVGDSLDLFVPEQINYKVSYTVDKLVSQIDFTFLNSNYQAFTGSKQPIYLYPGLNALFKVGITDLMEDYRVTGGVRLSANLSNNEYLISYSNLKGRLDKEMIFHRQTLENEYVGSQYFIVRQHQHEFHYMLKWPFNQVMSVRGSAIYRNDNTVFLSINDLTLKEPNQMVNWGGLKAEFVFDGTREIAMNLYSGTRSKVFAEYYKMLEKPNNELFVVGFDVRNYRKIHRTFIWANRFAGSSSFGKNKLIYYMGGVDNWLFPKFNLGTPVARDQGYAYQTLATNMRGFPQNIRNGNSFVVFNSELRLPLFRYFANKPIKADFINNFQIVGFGDVGTAWTGLNPYSPGNSLFTRVIEQGPLTITVEEQRNPIVGGYGFGLRSRILGYFMRADWAWGVEDGRVQPAVFYFSLSLDF